MARFSLDLGGSGLPVVLWCSPLPGCLHRLLHLGGRSPGPRGRSAQSPRHSQGGGARPGFPAPESAAPALCPKEKPAPRTQSGARRITWGPRDQQSAQLKVSNPHSTSHSHPPIPAAEPSAHARGSPPTAFPVGSRMLCVDWLGLPFSQPIGARLLASV